MKNFLPKNLINLANLTKRPLYLVGGVVRNFLIDKSISTDVDLAGTMSIEQIKGCVEQIGLTISVGVSFNKTFAKIGSDLKKPDATTEISIDNYKKTVWKLPIEDMFGIGRQTKTKLINMGVNTIGDLARFDKQILIKQFGKVGEMLYNKANGADEEEVAYIGEEQKPKSVGNSTTFYKDLTERKDIELGFTVIAENVVARMIKYGLTCAKTLSIVVKDKDLNIYQKQCQLMPACRDSKIYTQTALKLFNSNFKHLKVRLLGITVSDWCDEETQLSLFEKPKPNKSIDDVMLKIRNKYGINKSRNNKK